VIYLLPDGVTMAEVRRSDEELLGSEERGLDAKVQAKGRALSAVRLGLRQAQEDLIKAGKKEAAESCSTALRRSERMERDG
jgi:hypothetical protein